MTRKVKKSISISVDMEAWLATHSEINLSGLVERWLRNYAKAYEGSMDA